MGENIQTKSPLSSLSTYRSALMGMATIWVYIFHLHYLVFPWNSPIVQYEMFLKSSGFGGVDIFLFLSGIGMTYAISKSNVPVFYAKRISRLILPVLLTGIARALTENWSISSFFANVTGYSFYTKSIYSFLWYVQALVFLYLLFPLFWKGFQKTENKELYLIGILSLWFLVAVILKEHIRNDLYGFINRIPVFIIGTYFGYRIQQNNVQYRTAGRFAWLGVFLCGVYLSWQANMNVLRLILPVTNACLPPCLLAVSSCCLLADFFCLEKKKPIWNKILSPLIAVLTFIGKISLEFYCVQDFICSKADFSNVILNLFPESIRQIYALVNIVVFLCVLILSLIFHYAVEYIGKGISWVFYEMRERIHSFNKNRV